MSAALDSARTIALQAMIEGMEKLLAEDSPAWRLAIGWRGGDETCDLIGEQILDEIVASNQTGDPAPPEDLDLYIATQVYAGGGHTAVVGDFVRASAVARSEVIVTGTVERDIHQGEVPPEVIERLGIGPDALTVCPCEDRAAATRWLIREIRERRPRRVFLFHHPQDAVAIAGARPSLCGELYLVHHADRQPTLGLHQRGSRIVDLSPFTGEFTRRVLGMDSRYAPLIIGDPGPPAQREIERPFHTVSSGSAHKFGDDYAANLARILETTGGRHTHIGFLKAKRLEKIRSHLTACGIDPARIHYVEWVPSLAGALIEIGADLCISSAPMGGARTAIESAAAGVPILAHVPDFSTLFGVNHVMPKSLPVWRTIDELVALLEKIDPAWIVEQGRIGREYYEQHHHPDQLKAALADLPDSKLPMAGDRPLSELVDVGKVRAGFAGEWAFLRGEFADGVLASNGLLPP